MKRKDRKKSGFKPVDPNELPKLPPDSNGSFREYSAQRPRPSDAFLAKSADFNPLRWLNPSLLTQWLEEWQRGWIRNLWRLGAEICERDDVLVLDVAKRKNAVASRASVFQVVPLEQQKGPKGKPDAETQAHCDALTYFYRNLSSTSCVDLNIDGGIQELAYFMMDALIQKYSTFEILWKNQLEGITANLLFVPGTFLENTHGYLRYTGPVNGLGAPRDQGDPVFEAYNPDKSVDLNASNWMVATNQGFCLKALCILYQFKTIALKDWMNLIARFGVPWVIGIIDAPNPSQAFSGFVSALQAMGSDGVLAVTGGPQNGGDAKVEIKEPSSGANAPAQALVDRIDRRITSILRGADLMSQSRKNAVGSNIQQDEGDLMEEADCEWLTATLRRKLDGKVIARLFGPDAIPKAGILVSPKPQKDITLEIQKYTFALQAGLKISQESIAETLDIELDTDSSEDDLAHAPTPTGQSADEIQQGQMELQASAPEPAANSAGDGPRDDHGRWTQDTVAKAIQMRRDAMLMHSVASEKHLRVHEAEQGKSDKYQDLADKTEDAGTRKEAQMKADFRQKRADEAMGKYEHHLKEIQGHREQGIRLLGIQKSLGASNTEDFRLNGHTVDALKAAARADSAPILAAMTHVMAADTPDETNARLLELGVHFPGLKDRLAEGSHIESVTEQAAVEAMLETLEGQQ